MPKPVVVIPNLNGGAALLKAVESLHRQTLPAHIILVDNSSSDNSAQDVLANYPEIEFIENLRNEGYAGGVNPGIKRAMELGAEYVAPFNNDAVADSHWLESLVNYLTEHPTVGAVTPKVLNDSGKKLDSTGDFYTVWGLPYPRGRGSNKLDTYDHLNEVFAASGAACLYRVSALQQVGMLDEDFFAYYEDVDLSFRLQLSGWKVAYEPRAVVFHGIGMTSSRIKGFTTYQTMKNLQLLWFKNVPRSQLGKVGRRLFLAQSLFFARAISRGQGWSALKGTLRGSYLLIKKRTERKKVQASRTVSDDYVWSILVHDLPANARSLRKMRHLWWSLTLRKEAADEEDSH